MKTIIKLVLVFGFIGQSVAAASERQSGTDLIVAFNDKLLQIADEEDGFLTLKGVRAATMMHLAIHDALNAIDRHYAAYLYENADAEGNSIAAAAEAAYSVASDQYPEQSPLFQAEREKWLAGIEDEQGVREGLDVGAASAAAVLAVRADDRWNSEVEYTWHPMAPGVYAEFTEHSGTPEGFIFGAGWATAKPFVLPAPDHFRASPPPEIANTAYAKAFEEVKIVGADNSTVRTEDQTHQALWWKDFAERSHNRLARQILVERDLDMHAAARLMALLNVGIFDAYVSVFENKFHYNHWRPYTAIRWMADDGNAQTEPQADWTNTHGHTYAFPSYPSAHGTACAAAMSAFAEVLGNEVAFTMTTREVDVAGPFSGKMPMDPPDRHFAAFSDAAMECALSRVYLGIHFRYDSIAGNELGTDIGMHIKENALQPTGRP